MRQRFAIITGWTIIILAFCVFISNAFPPTPPTSIGTLATQNADAINATGGNVTGLTNLGAVASNITGVSTANVINASGLVSVNAGLRAVPTATNPIMIGNTTAILATVGANVSAANPSVITIDATVDDNLAVGDLAIITAGTNCTQGMYRVATITANTSVTLDRQAASGACTGASINYFKDVVTVGVSDGTNGQMLTGWSHTNKPLQIGGSSLATAPSGATAGDILIPKDKKLYLGTGGSFIRTGSETNDSVYINTVDNIYFITGGGATGYWGIVGGHLYPYTQDNTYDIGTTTKRPRNLYLGAPAITAATGTGITVTSPGNVAQQVYKVTTVFGAYTDSDLTKGIVIATLPAKTRLVAAYADTTVAYAGTDITAATLEVGVTSEGAAEILATHNVFAGAILAGDADAEMGTTMTRAAKEQGAYMPSFTGTTAIYATIDATTGAATTLANLTAGSTTFYLITERLP